MENTADALRIGMAPIEQTPPLRYLELVTSAQRALYAATWALVRDPHAVDDVLQEVNVVLWSKAADYDWNRPFLPWAMRIVKLQSLAYFKRQSRQQRIVLDHDLVEAVASSLEARAGDNRFDERRLALEACLRKLTAHQRSLILQRYESGASVQVMAAALGKKRKALSESLRRVRLALLNCIEQSLAKEGAT